MSSVEEAKNKLYEWEEKLRKAKEEVRWWTDELRIRHEKKKNNKK